jgi:hypothetical protein
LNPAHLWASKQHDKRGRRSFLNLSAEDQENYEENTKVNHAIPKARRAVFTEASFFGFRATGMKGINHSARLYRASLYGCPHFVEDIRNIDWISSIGGSGSRPGWWCNSAEQAASERALDSAVVSERLAVVIANHR